MMVFLFFGCYVGCDYFLSCSQPLMIMSIVPDPLLTYLMTISAQSMASFCLGSFLSFASLTSWRSSLRSSSSGRLPGRINTHNRLPGNRHASRCEDKEEGKVENNKIITFALHLYLTDSFETIKFTYPNDTNLTFRLHLISPL